MTQPVPEFLPALDDYAASVQRLEAEETAKRADILAALHARDSVQLAVQKGARAAPDGLERLVDLDKRLKKRAAAICQAVKLSELRNSFLPAADAWWWRLESERPPKKMDKLEWMWNLLAILVVTLAVSLLLDIAPRFFSGGPDTFGAFTVMIQSVLTAVIAGGALTKAGRDLIDRTFKGLRIPEEWWTETRLILLLLLLVSLVGLRLSLGRIAVLYNNRGQESYAAGKLSSAEYDFKRALKLSPDYPAAHYNLGVLYEDLDDLKTAKTEYQLALKSGMPQAFNNLGRLYVLEGKKDTPALDTAVRMLLTGLRLTPDAPTRYSLLKNLGWARLKQERLAEARLHLEEALAIDEQRAAAHCLLAKTLDGQKQADTALVAWEFCRQLASPYLPDEDTWLNEAVRRLEQPEATP